jgi:hypothetical protein
MKIDPVVSSSDELFMANMTQLNKIKYLETEKQKREDYIHDLEQTLTLNKQSISLLTSEQHLSALDSLNQ